MDLKQLLTAVLLFTIIYIADSQGANIRIGSGKISINDMESRRYFEEKGIKVDPEEALCFRSIGPIGYYNEQRPDKEDKKIREWKAKNMIERIDLKAVVNETNPLCKSQALDMFFKYKFQENGYDHVDVWVKTFQANLMINQPESCDEKKFIEFFDQIRQVRSQEYVDNKQSTVYECHPIVKSEELEIDEDDFRELRLAISTKMQEFEISKLLGSNDEIIKKEEYFVDNRNEL